MRHFMRDPLKLTVLFLLTLISCNYNADQDKTTTKSIDQIDVANKPVAKTAKSSLHNDTLIVDIRSAVFVLPDSFRIEKRRKEIGEENFQIGADDYAFYMNTAGEFLDSVNMVTLNTKDKRFIKFIQSDKTQQIIKIDKLPELWSIYFFDPTKRAKQVDMTIVDDEYKNYFR